MAGGQSIGSAGGLPPAGQSSTSNTSAGKGPGQPMSQPMIDAVSNSQGGAAGKSPGQPQVQQPSTTTTTVAPGGTTGIDPKLYNPMAPQVQKPMYPGMGYPQFDPMMGKPQIGALPPGMSPYAQQFAQGQGQLAGLGQQIGVAPLPGMIPPGGPGPGGQPLPPGAVPGAPMNPPALGLPPGAGGPVPINPPALGLPPQGGPANTATTLPGPQTQPMNPNRQREMDEHNMRGGRMDNDNDEMRRRGMGYGNRMDNDRDEMQRRQMGRGPGDMKPQPGIAGLSPAERMKRMQ